MHNIVADLRFAVRSLLRQRGFTTVAVLTLALGVGAAGTMFSVVNGILLRPLPYSHPDQILAVDANFEKAGVSTLSVPEFDDIRAQLMPRVFSKVAMVVPVSGNLAGVDVPERIESRGVTGDFFQLLDVKPELGRTFIPSDETPGITQIAVISHSLWQRRYNGTRDVLGKTLLLDDDPYTIVGVMPSSFEHPGTTRLAPVDFWYPAGLRATPFGPPVRASRQPGSMVFARLAGGVTPAQAQRELDRVAANVGAAHPADYANHGIAMHASVLRDNIVGATANGLLTLLGAVALVLLIACTNVAALQLTRGTSRSGELSVRQALGARRRRIIQQLLTESAVLGGIGGAVGVAAAAIAVHLLRTNLPLTLPRASEVALDGRVALVSMTLAILLTMIFGIIPALAMTRTSLGTLLRGASRGGSVQRGHTRSALVVVEVALTVMLLVGSGLLIRSYRRIQQIEPGFKTDHLLTMQIAIPYPNDPTRGKYVNPAARVPYFTSVIDRVRTIPGVSSAALMSTVPFTDGQFRIPISAEGDATLDPRDLPVADVAVGSAGMFGTLGIPLREGRDFRDTDTRDAARIIVISERVAKRFFPHADALGKRMKSGPPGSPAALVTIVGVVGDVRSKGLNEDAPLQIYMPYTQLPAGIIGIVARTNGDPDAIAPTVANTVRSVERDQPVYAVHTMDALMATTIAQRRFAMQMLGAFAALALALAVVGLYGLIAYSVSQRTRELGLRMALGSSPWHAIRLVVAHGLALALGGTLLGAIGAAFMTRVLSTLVYGVSTHDPLTFVAAPVVLLCAAGIAALIPGRRAASVDPMVALRE